ncbi:MAG: hypothetical protein WC091_15520 [Sulfuricellaceae bacterium]
MVQVANLSLVMPCQRAYSGFTVLLVDVLCLSTTIGLRLIATIIENAVFNDANPNIARADTDSLMK